MKYTGRAFAELAREIDQEIGNIKPDAPTPKRNPSKVLDKVASGVKRELRFTPVHRYLVKRGIKLIPQNVGYHPELGYYEDGKLVNQFPAMVARIITVKGQRISFHVTYLTNSGEKAGVSSPKKILAPLEPGVGVYLDQPGESIVVGEGIETTLAGMQLFGLPGIAGLNAGGLEGLQVPSFVRSVTVLADADQNYTGQAAAFALAKRLVREGKEVSVEVPDMGLDYADMLFN
jgi:putative DNA primase/helicase